MSELIEEYSLPMICTRGVVMFPQLEETIRVGRSKSLSALEIAKESFDNTIFLVFQKNQNENSPTDDVYDVGTICKIKRVHQCDGFKQVTFIGQKRAKIVHISENEKTFFATVTPLYDRNGDSAEEMALIRRVTKEIEELAKNSMEVNKDVMVQLTKGVNASQLADRYAQYFQITNDKKQEILEELNINDRLLLVIKDINIERGVHNIEGANNDCMTNVEELSSFDSKFLTNIEIPEVLLNDLPEKYQIMLQGKTTIDCKDIVVKHSDEFYQSINKLNLRLQKETKLINDYIIRIKQKKSNHSKYQLYERATALEYRERYFEASKLFRMVEDYKDSKEHLKFCEEKTEYLYNNVNKLYFDDVNLAYAACMKIIGYKDTEELIREIIEKRDKQDRESFPLLKLLIAVIIIFFIIVGILAIL